MRALCGLLAAALLLSAGPPPAPAARFLDTSYTEYATRVLGAWQP